VPLKGQDYADLLTPPLGDLSGFDIESTAVDANPVGRPARVASVAILVLMKRCALDLIEDSQQRCKHALDIALLER
jgi:phosphopantothenate synthetase